MTRIIALSFILLFLNNCKSNHHLTLTPKKLSFVEKKIFPKNTFETTHFKNYLKSHQINFKNGLSEDLNGDFTTILFTTNKNQVCTYNLEDSTKVNTIGSNIILHFKSFGNNYVGLNPLNNYYYIYKKLENNRFDLIDSLKFEKSKNKESLYTRLPNSNFVFKNNTVLSGFSSRKNKVNFIGDFALIKLTKETQTQVGHYPSNYFTEIVDDRAVNFDLINDSISILGFSHSNEISKFNINNNIEYKRVILESDTNFLKFDKTKKQNLAYISKFQRLTERNIKMLIDEKQNIIVIKQIKKFNFNDTNKYTCFVMNES